MASLVQAVALFAISRKTKRINGFIGPIMMSSYFLLPILKPHEDIFEAVQYYIHGLLCHLTFSLISDGSWIWSHFLNAACTFAFWASTNIPTERQHTVIYLAISSTTVSSFLSYVTHYMRRSIFYQKTKSEESSRKWLYFLEEHPDPIAIFSSKSGLLFKNRDFESTLQHRR